MIPKKSVTYISDIVNQILVRCRQHLERRNDFIQIMIDHEEQMKNDEKTVQSTHETEPKQQWKALKKSKN